MRELAPDRVALSDPNKTDPGQCGCGNSDLDSDGDGTANCHDACPSDANKLSAGVCGCGQADTDSDSDGVANCKDLSPSDRNRLAPGDCGCSNAPKPSGTACDDGLCAANNQCDGAGSCGTPSQCTAPDSQCTFAMRAGTDYWFCSNLRNFSDAQQRCKNAGMDLAVIRSADEDSFVNSKLTLALTSVAAIKPPRVSGRGCQRRNRSGPAAKVVTARPAPIRTGSCSSRLSCSVARRIAW